MASTYRVSDMKKRTAILKNKLIVVKLLHGVSGVRRSCRECS